MNKLEEENKTLRNNLSEEKKQSQFKNMRMTLQDRLDKKGISAELRKAAMSVLINEDKKVLLDKDGNTVFKGEYEDEYLSLDDGLDSWFKAEGKAFLPDNKPRGTGARPIKSQQKQASNDQVFATQEEADEALIDLIRQQRG
jgi:hypothetical protein